MQTIWFRLSCHVLLPAPSCDKALWDHDVRTGTGAELEAGGLDCMCFTLSRESPPFFHLEVGPPFVGPPHVGYACGYHVGWANLAVLNHSRCPRLLHVCRPGLSPWVTWLKRGCLITLVATWRCISRECCWMEMPTWPPVAKRGGPCGTCGHDFAVG